jgi:hypothetical protein
MVTGYTKQEIYEDASSRRSSTYKRDIPYAIFK